MTHSSDETGLTAAHKVAMSEAFGMRDRGEPVDQAVGHLVKHGMPRVVAKVLVNQYDRTSG